MPPKPLILSFDTSAAHCAAALLRGDEILATVVEPMAKGQVERLFPLLEEVLAAQSVAWADLDAVGVCVGPGNFTGVRISVSAARGLAFSLGVPAVGVSRLEAIAFGRDGLVAVDARQKRVYCQRFERGAALDAPQILAVDDVTGGCLADSLIEGLSAQPVRPEEVVGNVARLAARRWQGDVVRPAPLYIRAPDAALPSDPPPVILP